MRSRVGLRTNGETGAEWARDRPSIGSGETCAWQTTRRCSRPWRRPTQSTAQLLPAYVWEPRRRRRWAPGAAARWWLWHSLSALDGELRERGSWLTVLDGDPTGRVLKLAATTGARAVYWAAGLEPHEAADDEAVAAGAARRRRTRRRRAPDEPALRSGRRPQPGRAAVHDLHAVLACVSDAPPTGAAAAGAR